MYTKPAASEIARFISMPHVQPRGSSAEQIVAEYLIAHGWQIVEQRLRISHYEVDLLIRRDAIVALVEVRSRRISGWVSAFDSIDLKKRKALQKAAKLLWDTRFEQDASVEIVRIDVAAVTWGPTVEQKIEILEGAIEVFL